MSNFWDSVEEWDPRGSGGRLGPGEWVVTIDAAEVKTSRNGHPQIELSFSNETGSARDWLTATVAAAPRVKQFVRACGVAPTDTETEAFKSGQGLGESYAKRIVGQKVGIVTEQGAKYVDVVGYVPVEDVKPKEGQGVAAPPPAAATAGDFAGGFPPAAAPAGGWGQSAPSEDTPF